MTKEQLKHFLQHPIRFPFCVLRASIQTRNEIHASDYMGYCDKLGLPLDNNYLEKVCTWGCSYSNLAKFEALAEEYAQKKCPDYVEERDQFKHDHFFIYRSNHLFELIMMEKFMRFVGMMIGIKPKFDFEKGT